MRLNSLTTVPERIRARPFLAVGLFGYTLAAQLGHLIEHIAVAIQGRGLLGSGFDNELSHLVFNTAIAGLSALLVVVWPRNPWVYPLAILASLHVVEHIYIFHEFVITGVSNGPGLLGRGGAIGLVPLDRIDLHNIYNGLEMILIVLGFGYALEDVIAPKEE